MLTKKTFKNQITLPKEVIRYFPDTEYFDVTLKGREIVVKPVIIKTLDDGLDKIRAKIKNLGLTEKDIAAAISWARSKG